MEEEFDGSQIRKASQFLERLGLKYESMSSPTKRYLLNLVPSGDAAHMMGNPGNVLTTKFASMVDNEMVPVSGGRVSFPSEYFGASLHPSYTEAASGTVTSDVPLDGCTARMGLSAGAPTMAGGARKRSSKKSGGDPDFFNTKDIDQFRRAYETKFLRQLRMTKQSKDHVRTRMNNMLNKAILDTARAHGGKVVKGGLATRLKEARA